MYFSDKITLRSVVIAQGANGYPTETNTDTIAWANVQSVARSEFYSASLAGIDAVMSFEIHVDDWTNQPRVVYNSQVYYVVRSYQKGLGIVVLTCSDKAA